MAGILARSLSLVRSSSSSLGRVASSLRRLDADIQEVVEIVSPGPLTDTNKIDGREQSVLLRRRGEAKAKLERAQGEWTLIARKENYRDETE